MISFLRRAGWIFVMTVALAACSSDEPVGKNEYVNNWILEEMELYYLWNATIPNSPDKSLTPDAFFESLLSNEDRFSWIQDNYEELLNSLQGINKEAGYEFKLYRKSSTNEDVIAQVMYIKPGSPAASHDLIRGDVITHINGQKMSLSNYQSLLSQINQNHSITYERNMGGGVFESKGALSLTTVEFAENPHFMNKVMDYPAAGKKIGYYVYNFFPPGVDDGEEYNNAMVNIFGEFKAAGVTDLVLDLRYNSGGAESSTILLASLLGNGVNNTKVFVERQFNTLLQEAFLNDPSYGTDYLIKKFQNKNQNIGSEISGKLYVLTSGRTASASELLINGLKPYMSQIIIIGDTTVGKNVGSFSLFQPNDPKNKWGMQPIVVKSYNSLHQSDYSTGFYPDIVNLDNSLDIKPLGDPEEELLSIAISEITGGGGRRPSAGKVESHEVIGTSADFKRGSYNLVIDDERIKNLFKPSLQP